MVNQQDKKDWQPIKTAPYGTVLEVRNQIMSRPVKATRGYVKNNMVYANQLFFTSVYTPNDIGGFPAGQLVCPTEWRTL